jgi:hypothetical protein
MISPPVRFPIGLSDFRSLRQGGLAYVDKSGLIDDVLLEGAQVLLAPRPRRFGKTLNLSMLRYFFEKSESDVRPLFDGLAVASSKIAWAHFQRYPVLFMSFKDVKPTSWEHCFEGIGGVLAGLYGEHRYLLTEGNIAPEDAKIFTDILERRASYGVRVEAIKLLSRLLAQHHGERVVILLDEYDSPVHAGYTHKYYDQVIAFFRDFLSGGLKDNVHLFKGVLTGILRVARESLFSGLNNVRVCGILQPKLATAFGFTEPEVLGLLETVGKAGSLDRIRAYYNGYLFGGQAIYNPWSVLSFLDSGDDVFRPYWIETSSNDLVRDLLLMGPEGSHAGFETLLAGGAIDRRIDENIVLRDVAGSADAIWSFLLFTGYLKAIDVRYLDDELRARLVVPNREVAGALRSMVRRWFREEAGGTDQLQSFLDALLRGDAPVVERHLAHMVKVNLSFFDTASPEPERFYHGLVVGLLAGLAPRYDVRSNRESGFGRCDVMVLPREAGQSGVVLELKRVDTEAGETKEKALTAALRQIRERDYAAELRERGATPIHQMAAVFEGKRVFVRLAAEKKPTARKAAAKGKAKRASR